MNTNTSARPMNLSEINAFLGRCVRALAGVCDHAHQHDGQGFNGGDADFGHSMAQRDPASYSPKMTAAMVRMLRKYRKQLQGFGLDYDTLPEGLDKWEAIAAMQPAIQPVKAAAPAQTIAGRTIEEMPGGYYKVSFPYNPQCVAEIKALQCFRKFERDEAGCFWLVRLTGAPEKVGESAAAFAKFAINNRFAAPVNFQEKMIAAVGKAIEGLEAKAENHALSSAEDAEITIEGIGGELMPFQRGGVAYGTRNPRAIIGDEMGLGKTPQSLVILEAKKAFPALIVCRASLKINWLREAKKWLLNRKSSGNVYDRAAVTVVTHDELTKHNEALAEMGFKGLIGDESQDFKNHKAQRSKGMMAIAESIPQDGVVLLLSGTPVENRPSEFISQLRIIGKLDDFGGWKGFTNRYCDAHQTRFGIDIKGASNLEELNRKLRETCYIRREKAKVLKELPDKIHSIVDVQLSNREAYNATVAEVRQRLTQLVSAAHDFTLAEMSKVSEMPLAGLLAYIGEHYPKFSKGQLLKWEQQGGQGGEELEAAMLAARKAIHSALLGKEMGTENAGAFMELGRLMERAGLGKIEAVAEWVREFIEAGGKKVILFAKHIPVQKALAEAIPGAIWTRSGKFASSQEAVDQFQNNPEIPVIVCSLKGDNAGLNITAASYVLFVERDWKTSTHLQAEDRAHRIGQKNCVNVYYFDAVNSVDDVLSEIHKSKQAILDAVLDGGEVDEQNIMRAVISKIMGERA